MFLLVFYLEYLVNSLSSKGQFQKGRFCLDLEATQVLSKRGQ